MSKRFNFDDFDAQIAEALEEHEASKVVPLRRPGEIGSVAVRLTSPDFDPLPEPPEAA